MRGAVIDTYSGPRRPVGYVSEKCNLVQFKDQLEKIVNQIRNDDANVSKAGRFAAVKRSLYSFFISRDQQFARAEGIIRLINDDLGTNENTVKYSLLRETNSYCRSFQDSPNGKLYRCVATAYHNLKEQGVTLTGELQPVVQ